MGETFVALRVISGNLEKEIAAHVQAAVAKVEKAVKITPKIDSDKTKHELSKLDSIFKASFDQLRAKLGQVAQSGGPVSSTFAKIAEKATAIGPAGTLAAAGIAAVGVEAVASTHAFIDFAEQVHKFELLSGASTQDASRFVVALRLLGVDADRVGAGLFRLSRNAGSAGSQLTALGIATAHTQTGSVDLVGTFLNIADAVQKAGGGSESAKVAFAAFGRSGLALLPILARGREGLQALFAEADKNHEILSQNDVDTAIRLKIQLKELQERLHAIQIDAGKNFSGGLSKAVTFLEVEEAGAVKTTHALGTGIHFLTTTVTRGAEILGGHAEATRHDGHAARETAQDIQVLVEKYKEQEAAAQTALGSIQSQINAQHSFNAATRAVADAQYNVGEAERRVAELRRHGAVDVAAVRSAQQQYQHSTESLTKAEDELAKAEQHVADVRQGAKPLELESANLRVSQTTNALVHAQKDLTDLQRHGHASALDLSDAQNAVTAAQIEAEQAQQDLTDTQNKGKDGSDDLTQALDELQAAQDNVTQAANDQKQSADDLRKAQAGDPDFAHNLAAAERDVASAKQSVNDANDARANAAIALFNATATETDAINNLGGAYGTLRNELQLIAGMYGIDLGEFLNVVGGAAQNPNVSISDAQGTYNSKGQLQGTTAAPSTPPTSSSSAGQAARDRRNARAVGGPTSEGYWYNVNEDGTEWFKSNSSGTVYPIGQRPVEANSGVDQRPIVQNIHGAGDPQLAAQYAALYLGRALRTHGR